MADDLSVEGQANERAARAFKESGDRFQQDTNSAEAAWEYGRACFDLSEWVTNNTGRAEIAEKGIAACRQSIASKPALAPGHYYLGMNLGQLADTKRNLAALKIVKEMERDFQTAADLDSKFDYAGADRNLGLLYLQSPAIVSVGSRNKARLHLRRAIDLAPGYPENRLNLIEALLKWNDLAAARREVKSAGDLWPQARLTFAGDAWAASWLSWDKRLKSAKTRLDQASKSIESPRHED